MKKMAICITAYEPGGQSVVLEELSKRFAEFFDIDLYCVYSKKSKPDWIKKIHHVKPWLNKYIPMVSKDFIRDMKNEKYDIIHCHDSLPFIDAFDKNGIEYYVTCHGNSCRYRNGLISKIDGIATLIFYKIRYKRVRVVFAISQYVKMWLKKVYNISAQRIYNGTSEERFYVMGVSQNSMVFEEKPILLYFGQISARKGISDLIRGIEQLKVKYPKILLLIGGFGEKSFLSNLNILIKNKKLENNIKFLGYIKDEDQVLYYNSCDAVVTASYWEGFGLPIIESYRCGKPIFVRNSTAMSELVTDERFKFVNVDEMARKIDYYLTHDKEFKINFREILDLNLFSWDYSAKQYLKYFNQ